MEFQFLYEALVFGKDNGVCFPSRISAKIPVAYQWLERHIPEEPDDSPPRTLGTSIKLVKTMEFIIN
jgi:hypothetical protein